MTPLRRGEFVTVVPLGARGCYRALVLRVHEDIRRAYVEPEHGASPQIVWSTEIQHDPAPTFATINGSGETLS